MAATTDKPNVVLIFADDIGYEGLGAYGGLDLNAASESNGKRGTSVPKHVHQFHLHTIPVSLHTGTYTFRHKHTDILPVHLGTKQKVTSGRCQPWAAIQKNGYMTAVTGKWQLATRSIGRIISGMPVLTHGASGRFGGTARNRTALNPTFNRNGKVMDGLEKRFGPDVLADYVIEKMTRAGKKTFLHCSQ